MADARADDAVAIPPAPNWYGSNHADWGGADGELYAYAARNAVVLLRPLSPDARHAGALVGHTNRVTALCFARGPGADGKPVGSSLAGANRAARRSGPDR